MPLSFAVNVAGKESIESIKFIASSEELNPKWRIKLVLPSEEQDYNTSVEVFPGLCTNSFNSVMTMVIGLSTNRVLDRVEVDGVSQFRLTIEFEDPLQMPTWVFYLKKMDDVVEYWRSRCLLAEETLKSIYDLKDQPRDIRIQFDGSSMKFTGKIISSLLKSDVVIRSCRSQAWENGWVTR